jgi:hypothetical protein
MKPAGLPLLLWALVGAATSPKAQQPRPRPWQSQHPARRPEPPYRVWCSPPIYNFYEVYPYFRGANLIMNHDLPPVTSWKQAVNDSNNVTHEVTYAGAANPVYAQEGMTIMKGAPGPNAEEPCSMTNTTMVRCLRAFLTIPVV